MTLVHTATEDELSEAVACKIIINYMQNAEIGLRLRKGGIGHLQSSLHKFRQIANREHVLLLVDLDRRPCAPHLIEEWFGQGGIPMRLLFRVVVREIESWLLADRAGIASLFEISEANLPANPDDLPDPKETLLVLARRSPRRVRSDLLRTRGSLSIQGLGYNRVLIEFVENTWGANRARLNSPSLNRALNRLTFPLAE